MAGKTADPQVGDTFGRLTIIDGIAIRAKREKYFRMLCICGNTKTVAKGSLVSGRSTSCGCFNAEQTSLRSTTHGKRKDPIYAVWNMMVQRCTHPSNKEYKHYGARGTTVCDSWRKFENFYRDMGDAPFERATLDRIDNDKGYSKENCRWATYKEQQSNTTRSIRYKFRGQQLSIREVASLVGINLNTLTNRVYTYGMSIEEAASTPVMTPQAAQALQGSPIFERVGKRLDGQKLYTKGDYAN